MAALGAMVGGLDAVTFMVSAGLVFEIVAAACSSPQTAQINADRRSETLMFWVKAGLATAGFFVVLAAVWLKGGKSALIGGGLAGLIMWFMYAYANKAGLASAEAGTEN